MTTVTGPLPRRRLRGRAEMRAGAIAGMLVCLALLAGWSLLASGHRTSGAGDHRGSAARNAERAQLTSWETAVQPLIQSAGEVVALGPRQGAQQISGTEFSAAANRHMATGWVARLTQLRAQMASLHSPQFLGGVRELLDRSMAGYILASQDLLDATTATGPRRTTLLDAATTAGRAADRLYDQATAAIAALRVTLGLPADWSRSS